ncbi:SAM-dependent chlorinase/fluorinase [Nonomuraea sp. NPDC001023]|uniref:SAM hydrolase/SAM-dependent halogenase family protein n=1 Tax=unclassified Nonomuraea TaxID=2593643 RepID=UPI00332A2BD4
MTPVITLLTDYGLEDGYVAACHGVIAGIAPEARVIDVCHLVPPGDVRRGAAILAQTIPYLPEGVHIGAVDPGAGGARRSVAVEAGGRMFVGGDLQALGVQVGDTLGVWLGRRQLALPFRATFAAVPPGELVAFTDSAGLIAIAVNSGDAAQRLGLPPGAHVRLSPTP